MYFLKEPCISAGISVTFRTLYPLVSWWNFSVCYRKSVVASLRYWRVAHVTNLNYYNNPFAKHVSFRFDDTTKTRDSDKRSKTNVWVTIHVLTLCIPNNANAFIHGCNSVVLIIFWLSLVNSIGTQSVFGALIRSTAQCGVCWERHSYA